MERFVALSDRVRPLIAGLATVLASIRWTPGRAAALTLFACGLAFAQPSGTVVVQGLNDPQDVLVAPDGTIYVAGSGKGGATNDTTASVEAVTPQGKTRVVAHLPSIADSFAYDGANGLAWADGSLYVTVGSWWNGADYARPPLADTVVRVRDGKVVKLADPWAFEASHNPDTFELDSHPYRVAVGPHGRLWVADSAANDLLSVDPATGTIQLVAVFPGVPGRTLGNPRRGMAKEDDPVPTGLVVRKDGTALVALLPGGAAPPGSSKIVEVARDGTLSDYATGLTTVTDLAVGPDGKLYAIEFGTFNGHNPVPSSGALVRVTPNGATTVLAGLDMPTAVAFTARGDALVTVDGAGLWGRGKLLRFAGIAAPGSP